MQALKKSEVAPGSDEAIAAGCVCPVLDNAHGKGYMGGVKDEEGETVYIISWVCPLHGVEEVEDDYGPMITSEGICSNCGHKLELDLRLSELDFQAEESGVQPGTVHGPTVYWAAGTIGCPSCGVRLPFETSSD